MKSILISIKPEWVEKILSGEKTIEIRKIYPHCELPCKVYIYCTKGKQKLLEILHKGETKWFGKDEDDKYEENIFIKQPFSFDNINKDKWLGKVVAEFTLKQVEKIIYLTDRESVKKHGCWECKLEDKWKIENGLNKSQFNPEDYSNYYTEGSDDNYLIFYSKLTGTELHNYLKGRTGYAWHINNLLIYDTPKELSEFIVYKKCNSCEQSGYESSGCMYDEHCKIPTILTRPPQNWCYVEEC